MINSKGSSPAEMLGPGYKTVLKPALMAHVEENKRITVSNLAESVDLQKQVHGSAKILEEEKSNIATLQAKHDKASPSLHYPHFGVFFF
jgi:kinetochore protein NDC80